MFIEAYAGIFISSCHEQFIGDIVIHEKNAIVQYVYGKLMVSCLSKATYKFIRSKDYNKTFVPLRIQKKLESMNKQNRMDPFMQL